MIDEIDYTMEFNWESSNDQSHPEVKKEFNELEKWFWEEKFKLMQNLIFPKSGTYEWYRCFDTGIHIVHFTKVLAEKAFPDFSWKVFTKKGRVTRHNSKLGHSTVIGRNVSGEFMIFDLVLFDKGTVTEILNRVGLDEKKLARKRFKKVLAKP
jgi:hypothetical protein